ncbi:MULTISPECIES: hypothetical protein [Novosphingobium]|uniref:DUF4870 domain-containing protein n=1 Tax=Novosphingobium mangrovi (ex Hu et al. 2023) TaxID=2930094 RepID=A0ABT0ADD8_9SPHN|nr:MULTISPECIES: hypothetical protein [Novosphingobium]MCJ1961216.1 hypothetical protein [Novosphingobium mangrovi (ex Hu et al. 2023)]TYC86253.1 hypothetical protein FMM79_15010 [Novosphingobium sp. BW1]
MNDSENRPAASNSSFELNNPTVICLLYFASFLTGVTAIIGVVLAFVWRGEPKADWELSHYQYLINTFWIGLVGGILGFVLMIVLIGFLILPAVSIWVIVRTVMSLLKAQKREPMPDPNSWTI